MIKKKQFWHFLSRHRRLRSLFLKTKGLVTPFPSVFLFGVEKSGTTTLYDYIQQHPDVGESLVKENWFFHNPNSLLEYKGHFPILKKGIDAQPTYYRNKELLLQIKKSGINPSFIMIIRDPADRIVSAWNQCHSYGWDKRTLNDAIIDELMGDTKFGYFIYSKYIDRLEDFREVFPDNPLHVLTLEDLEKQPQIEMTKVFNFLKLNPYEIKPRKYNVGKYDHDIDSNILEYLRSYFQPYNKKLIEFIGYNPYPTGPSPKTFF